MRKIILICTLVCISVIGWAQKSGNYGNLKWELSNDTLFISGTGNMLDFPKMRIAPPWFTNVSELISSKGHSIISDGLTCSTIVISDGVTSIGDLAFAGCDSLTSVIIPNSVTRIGNKAFCSCHNLVSVTIPGSVTEIGQSAFSDITNLNSVTIMADTPPEFITYTYNDVTKYPFDGENSILYVSKGKISLYKKAGWDKFFKKIAEK